MRRQILSLTVGLALAPLAAFAADTTPPVQQTSAANPSPDLIVCHYYYTHGTVVKNPDCHPLRYWAWRRHELQQDIRDFQMRGLAEKD
jgi:hypothetical protein